MDYLGRLLRVAFGFRISLGLPFEYLWESLEISLGISFELYKTYYIMGNNYYKDEALVLAFLHFSNMDNTELRQKKASWLLDNAK